MVINNEKAKARAAQEEIVVKFWSFAERQEAERRSLLDYERASSGPEDLQESGWLGEDGKGFWWKALGR